MRLKNKPWAGDFIADYPEYMVTQAEEWKGQWQTRFANEAPIYLEIGTGKGRFIVEMAKKHPEINFIGLELQTSAIVAALEKQITEELPNLQLINGNANRILEYFEAGEIQQLMLTFSDPWPKNRHAKKRLTHRRYLEKYEEVLAKEGELFFKTDNQELFEFSLMSLNDYGMRLKEVILDLHNSAYAEENIMTEFEEKYSKKGKRIYHLQAQFKQ